MDSVRQARPPRSSLFDASDDHAAHEHAHRAVLLGNADGTFRPALNYTAGPAPFGLATGVFRSGTGAVDILATNFVGTQQDTITRAANAAYPGVANRASFGPMATSGPSSPYSTIGPASRPGDDNPASTTMGNSSPFEP